MNKRILVVEDQPDNRQIIRDMLQPCVLNWRLYSRCDGVPQRSSQAPLLWGSEFVASDVRLRTPVLDTLSATAHDARHSVFGRAINERGGLAAEPWPWKV
jgi:CheY-like chemotaxis protein